MRSRPQRSKSKGMAARLMSRCLLLLEASTNGAGPEPAVVEAEVDVLPETENPPAHLIMKGSPSRGA